MKKYVNGKKVKKKQKKIYFLIKITKIPEESWKKINKTNEIIEFTC